MEIHVDTTTLTNLRFPGTRYRTYRTRVTQSSPASLPAPELNVRVRGEEDDCREME